MKNVDLLTVFFAAAIYMVMYILWYSNILFGKVYEKILKTTKKKPPFYHYFLLFLFLFVISYVMSLFEVLMGVTTFFDGIFLGFLIWLGLVTTHSLFLVVSFKRSIKLYALDNLLYLLALMIVGGILAG
ncbi:MAG: hypothetical protein KR126chlam4_00916 [Candidatus Anoxychlamydiales bacterium]|uniref:DUF1761 domain-containing protein n=1 Tax=marine sediment metagenome TaxID=412755 RepID=A0A0F9IWX2_9ZZZZ|nr:hypothetical protein [Candidatus Anoxychlamydiales bacterium]NGX41081.1 hypothetical protein [Candidatus Anoxychlamydiales bacterium]